VTPWVFSFQFAWQHVRDRFHVGCRESLEESWEIDEREEGAERKDLPQEKKVSSVLSSTSLGCKRGQIASQHDRPSMKVGYGPPKGGVYVEKARMEGTRRGWK